MPVDYARTEPLVSAAIATGAASARTNPAAMKTYQASGTTSAGSGAATILIQGANDATNWETIGTISLTLGTAATSASFASNDRYSSIRANVSAISGTGASVSATVGY
jgi:hypothetical protein